MRSVDDPLSVAAPLFTGDLRVLFPGGSDRPAEMTISQSQPLPMTILSIMPDETVDG